MSKTLADFHQLTETEQYFEFFDLPYDPAVVNINRLHILQKFSNLLRERQTVLAELIAAAANEAQILEQYRGAFQQAYELFLDSNALEQKLFKVFHEKPPNIVLLSEIGQS